MTERVGFTLDGRPASAERDQSLLAALFDLGVRAVRSSVAGEPRGPLCAMGTCFECRVTVDGEPHVRACLLPVREGMDVRTCEARPTLGSPGGGGSRESVAAGSRAGGGPHGQPEGGATDGWGEGDVVSVDVAVVGAGPAGVAAAVHAAEAGARVLLVDANARPGGQIWRHLAEPPRRAQPWLTRLERAGARVAARASVVDAVPGGLLIDIDGRAAHVRAARLVLATGARELFLPFPGWTLPGVIGVGAAQALVKAGASFDGLRVLVAGSGPLLPAVAATLAGAGARVLGVVEQAPLPRLLGFGFSLLRRPAKAGESLGYAARLARSGYRTGAWPCAIERAATGLRVTLSDGRTTWSRDCDLLSCGFGLTPNLELACLLGCDLDDERVVTDDAQRTSVPGVFAAGELCGVAGVDHALVTGAIAGLAAAGRAVPPELARRRDAEAAFGRRLASTFALRPELRSLPRPDTIVCRCEDAAHGALERASSPREAKLHTRAGMGPCQGRVCGPALAFLRGFAADSTRPPLLPAAIAVLQPAGLAASPPAGDGIGAGED